MTTQAPGFDLRDRGARGRVLRWRRADVV